MNSFPICQVFYISERQQMQLKSSIAPLNVNTFIIGIIYNIVAILHIILRICTGIYFITASIFILIIFSAVFILLILLETV